MSYKIYQIYTWLHLKYWEEGLSIRDIANLCNVDPATIRYWMKKAGMKRRTKSQGCLNRYKQGKNPMQGKGHSVKSKAKMSNLKKGNKNPYYGKHKEENPNWKGGTYTYYANLAKQTWEAYWRQIVPKGYCIHHIDRKRENNHITNLALLTSGFHSKKHLYERIMKAPEFKNFITEEAILKCIVSVVSKSLKVDRHSEDVNAKEE